MFRQNILHKYRGFNLDYMILDLNDMRCKVQERIKKYNKDFIISELELISDLGFDFVRFPINYHNLIENFDEFWESEEPKFNEKNMAMFDAIVKRSIELGLHTNFALHTAPGYGVSEKEINIVFQPYNLWSSEIAQNRFIGLWDLISKRYNNLPIDKFSYNLVNEPPAQFRGITYEIYSDIVRKTVEKIRKNNDNRLVFADGMRWGRLCVYDICDIDGVVQSFRAYDPDCLTHAGCPGKMSCDLQKWPGIEYFDPNGGRDRSEGTYWDKDLLYNEYGKWAKMSEEKNIGVHCGEGGFYKDAPYEDSVRWFRDVMDILNDYNIGFALWGLSGPFGMVDVPRKGAKYIDYKGHKIDRNILEIMKNGIQ